MNISIASPDWILDRALEIVRGPERDIHAALDELPAAIYVTDPTGVITYFNRACIAFAGRTPIVGQDAWCVTWKLYSDDDKFMPHDECPMADAIRRKIPIRGLTAVAERPDGSRVNFMPYPTPLLGANGELLGAVNMLIDVTDRKQAGLLRTRAVQARRLATAIDDQKAYDTLNRMADEYEEKAAQLERTAAGK